MTEGCYLSLIRLLDHRLWAICPQSIITICEQLYTGYFILENGKVNKKRHWKKPENNQKASNKTTVSHYMEPHLPALEPSSTSFPDPPPHQLPQNRDDCCCCWSHSGCQLQPFSCKCEHLTTLSKTSECRYPACAASSLCAGGVRAVTANMVLPQRETPFPVGSWACTRTASPSSGCPVSANSINILHSPVRPWSCCWQKALCTPGQWHTTGVTQGCSGRQSAPEVWHRWFTGPQLERRGKDKNLLLLAFDLWCCCRESWGDGSCFLGGWLAVTEQRVVVCDQQQMWFVSAARSPADHGCSEEVSLSEEPAESLSKKSFLGWGCYHEAGKRLGLGILSSPHPCLHYMAIILQLSLSTHSPPFDSGQLGSRLSRLCSSAPLGCPLWSGNGWLQEKAAWKCRAPFCSLMVRVGMRWSPAYWVAQGEQEATDCCPALSTARVRCEAAASTVG